MAGVNIAGSTALVTGANRGIGKSIVEALLERGASKVYAGARRTETLEPLVAAHGDRVVPVQLDVTRRGEVNAAAEVATDVNLLFNNAGVALSQHPVTDSANEEDARKEFDVNVFGAMAVAQSFAPILAGNGGGAIVNLGSVASLVAFPLFPTYSATKAAVHSLTQSLRLATAPDGTLVTGVYPGPVDTDMAADIPFEKTSSLDVANEILDGVESGAEEVFTDPMAKEMGALYLQDPKGLERQVAQMSEPAS